jgi:hypothetical protein
MPAKCAGDVILEEMRDACREGLAHTIEEVRARRGRRQGSQRQHGGRTSDAEKPTKPGNHCPFSRVTDLGQMAEWPDAGGSFVDRPIGDTPVKMERATI